MPNTICAIANCSNSTYQLRKWRNTFCTTHQINFDIGRCTCPPPFRLFRFPKEKELSKQWTRAVSRKVKKNGRWVDWSPNDSSRICSAHFADGEPSRENPLPTCNLGRESVKPPKFRRVLSRLVENAGPSLESEPTLVQVDVPSQLPCPSEEYLQNEPRKYEDEVQVADVAGESMVDVEESAHTCLESPPAPPHPDSCESMVDVEGSTHTCPESPPATHPDIWSIQHDHQYLFWCTCSPMCMCEGCKIKEDTIRQKSQQIEALQTEIGEMRRKAKMKRGVARKLLYNDHKVSFYTGLPNHETFLSIFQHLEEKATQLTYWRGSQSAKKSSVRIFNKTPVKQGPARKMLLIDEFLLTLMKLRLDLPNEELADRFGVATATVSSVFNTWIKFLRQELSGLIFFPERDVVQASMPAAFKNRDCRARVIIDCTEVFIETPRDLQSQAVTWSDYKKHNTVKFLVGITPQGHIAFVSDAYGGRTSDRAIVRESGFLEKLDPGDEVMADRGFTIREDLLLRRVSLTIPPSAKGQEQMSKRDVELTKHVANLRIHVERAINRIKTFRILKSTLPISLVPRVDDIIQVCSALCNLAPPLVE